MNKSAAILFSAVTAVAQSFAPLASAGMRAPGLDLGESFEQLLNDAKGAKTHGGQVLRVSRSHANAYSAAGPAVVQIEVVSDGSKAARRPALPPGPFGGQPGGPGGPETPGEEGPRGPGGSAGSGWFVEPSGVFQKGMIITNNHVVEGAAKLTVTLQDKRQYLATVVGTDPKTDVAVIKVETGDPLPFIKWGDSTKLSVGQDVIAIGAPFGLKNTLTTGVISAMGRGGVGIADFEDFIQTDASINPGNSGGPLINSDPDFLGGQPVVIGMNTAIYSQGGSSSGIGFAVPVHLIKQVAAQLITNKGKVVRGWMGVAIQELTLELKKGFKVEAGVLINDVTEGGPSHNIIMQGDVVVAADGIVMTESSQLRNFLASLPPGKVVEFTVIRKGATKKVSVTVGVRPDDAELLGLKKK